MRLNRWNAGQNDCRCMAMGSLSWWTGWFLAAEGRINVTQVGVTQGEERDTSDEEWDAAYAAMDPLEQTPWGNCRAVATAVGTNLVRDVLAAADDMHDNAMSEMDGNTVMEEDAAVEEAGVASGSVSMSSGREANAGPLDSMEENFGGETAH